LSGEDRGCDADCRTASSLEALNRTCHCISLDRDLLRQELERDFGERELPATLIDTHPHLFASLPIFVPRSQIEQMARVVNAVEQVVQTPVFRAAALGWAPEIARFDPGTRGGLLGFDFHLASAGPQLIEINTNPGGVLVNAVLGRAQRSCCAVAASPYTAPDESADIEESIYGVLLAEWRLQRGYATLHSVAIVDESPLQQYLYPEFLLFANLLRRHGLQVVICDPSELVARDGCLWHGEQAIEFVYNRLTDFSLQLPGNAVLKTVYLAGAVVLSPQPRAHALYADKRNLALLSDARFVKLTGIADDLATTLQDGIPRTELLTAENRAAMWENRRRLFFKPSAGYGSKAAYRGDKLTKRVWEALSAGTYVAQALVAPSERHIADVSEEPPLKVDIRAYAYAGAIKQISARLYRGQTTNFRTPGGGFAPVRTGLQSDNGQPVQEMPD
jgi:hypothetical protein